PRRLHALSLHDALPIFARLERLYQGTRNHLKIAELYATVAAGRRDRQAQLLARRAVEMLDHVPITAERAAKLCQGMLACDPTHRSEEHTSELQSRSDLV